jgi:hypothetical protein
MKTHEGMRMAMTGRGGNGHSENSLQRKPSYPVALGRQSIGLSILQYRSGRLMFVRLRSLPSSVAMTTAQLVPTVPTDEQGCIRTEPDISIVTLKTKATAITVG